MDAMTRGWSVVLAILIFLVLLILLAREAADESNSGVSRLDTVHWVAA